jgi:deoxyribonuclease V
MEFPRNLTLDQAEEWQARHSSLVNLRSPVKGAPVFRTAAVLAAAPRSRGGKTFVAGVLVELSTGKIRHSDVVAAPDATLFPYVPGLEGFRFVPLYQELLTRLAGTPDVVMVEGAGVAHRRRFGLACHLGLATDLPTFGVSAACDIKNWDPPPPGVDGAHVFVQEGGELLGLAVRARAYRPPLFLSAGHKIGMMPALDVMWSVLGERARPDPFWPVRPLLSPKTGKGPAVKKNVKRPAARPGSKKKRGPR